MLIVEWELTENMRQYDKDYTDNANFCLLFMTKVTKKRKSWSSEDISAFEIAFAEEINKRVYPSRKKIRSAMEIFSVLKSRGESLITSRFQNLLRKN